MAAFRHQNSIGISSRSSIYKIIIANVRFNIFTIIRSKESWKMPTILSLPTTLYTHFCPGLACPWWNVSSAPSSMYMHYMLIPAPNCFYSGLDAYLCIRIHRAHSTAGWWMVNSFFCPVSLLKPVLNGCLSTYTSPLTTPQSKWQGSH
jgi:hypothetical protein